MGSGRERLELQLTPAERAKLDAKAVVTRRSLVSIIRELLEHLDEIIPDPVRKGPE